MEEEISSKYRNLYKLNNCILSTIIFLSRNVNFTFCKLVVLIPQQAHEQNGEHCSVSCWCSVVDEKNVCVSVGLLSNSNLSLHGKTESKARYIENMNQNIFILQIYYLFWIFCRLFFDVLLRKGCR